MQIERNSECPCGSGEKYKKCHGNVRLKKTDGIEVLRHIAYIGEVGRKRSKFCIEATKAIKDLSDQAAQKIRAVEKEKNIIVSCSNKCSYCCAQHVGCGLIESEVIVYFLYQNQEILKRFITKYPVWRASLDSDLYAKMNIAGAEFAGAPGDGILRSKYLELARQYFKQNIECPFLHEQSCSIYSVRPLACMSLLVISEPESCSASSTSQPQTILLNQINELPLFYSGNGRTVVFAPAPIMVFEILKNGVTYLSKIPGLTGLDGEFYADPTVTAVIKDTLF